MLLHQSNGSQIQMYEFSNFHYFGFLASCGCHLHMKTNFFLNNKSFATPISSSVIIILPLTFTDNSHRWQQCCNPSRLLR